MQKIEKLILYLSTGFAIFFQWVTIHYTEVGIREFSGFVSLGILLLVITYLVGIIENRSKRIK